MSLRLVFSVVLLLLFGAFVALNWSAFVAPVPLTVGLAVVDAPLGLVLLGVLAAVSMLFLGYMAWWQARILMETRRHTQELQAQRALADQAEASRFTALQAEIKDELARLAERIDTSVADTRQALQESDAALSAHLGEIEDRLERSFGLPR